MTINDDQTNNDRLEGLGTESLSTRRALGLAIVVFSPVLSAGTVGALAGDVAGSSAWLSVLAGTIVVACIGVAIVPFARRYVVSGALYSYIGHALGDKARLLSGASLAVGYPVGMMAIIGAFGLYAGSALATTIGMTGADSLLGQAVLYVLAIGSAALLAYRGLDASSRLSIRLLVISAPVVAIVLVANVLTSGFDFGSQFTFSDFSLSGFAAGIVLSTTFFVAFESSAATARETEDPMRTIPRLIVVVPMIVGGFAVLGTLLSVPTLGAISGHVANGMSPLAAMAENAGLGPLAGISDLCLAITCYAMAVGYMNYAPRVWATMAADGVLPPILGRIHPRRHTPGPAIVVFSAVSAAFPIVFAAVTGGTQLEVYTALATLFPYLWVVPYILVCVGAIVLLRGTGRLTTGTTIAAVVGAIGFTYVYVSAVLNPTGTSLDVMTWVAPVAVAVAAVILAVTRWSSRRGQSKEVSR